MKILYVKCNSERAKEFQLQTIIYEKDGQKFVKKTALCNEALPHLFKMYNNYANLEQSIINPKIKLAKIVEKSEKSLTFEYIEGVSYEKKYNQVSNDKQKLNNFIDEYKLLIETSFKITNFDSMLVDDNFRKIFGDFDYSSLDGIKCFDGISNIDMIFSNIIYNDNGIYIIDYEWVFEASLPIDYVLYRTSLSYNINFKTNKLYKNIESNFIGNNVCKISFNKYSINYYKNKLTIDETKQANQTNQELWQRVNQTEAQLEESNQTNQELWQRVNQAEDELFKINNMNFIAYIKRYFKQ